MNWIDEVKQILRRIAEDDAFRDAFFANPEAALVDVTLSDRARRYLINRVDADNFQDEYDRFFPQEGMIDRGGESTGDVPPTAKGAEDDGPPERIVSTGFADETQPSQPLDAAIPLAPDTEYYFWFEVGERVEGSIEKADVALPTDKLPPEARLNVVLFAFDGEIILTDGADVGEIKIEPDGTVRVTKPVHQPSSLVGDGLLTRRLFFPVQTSAQNGPQQMRCNIYYQQTLVQSRLVTVQVTENPARQAEPALESVVDYTLSKMLNGHQLEGMGANLLSVMLNDNGNGTHGFRFFGENEFKNDAAMGEGELADLINSARGALRKAAWGDERPYNGQPYRYHGPFNQDRLKDDLVRFAIRGYRFYDALINKLAGDADKAWDLADLMVKPGQVQIATKESVNMLVPAAMFYDYPLDDGLPNAQYSLCPDFLQALKQKAPLEETDCFQGNCPSHGKTKVVCPSGFWGYRHELGLPISVSTAPDAPTTIPVTGRPKMAVNVSTDPNFRQRPLHEKNLQKMGVGWDYADDREKAVALMKKTDSQVVYFYCHGGLSGTTPFLSVGLPTGPRLTRANLRSERIRWRKVRPLVFINGCHTTALTPEHAINFVSGFVEVSHAAGVIGTEITIYEPIAVAFAEACLHRFLIKRETIGAAVRGARLKMLKEGNPLGLVYIPYVMAGLKLAA
jgi:hypothetical protein